MNKRHIYKQGPDTKPGSSAAAQAVTSRTQRPRRASRSSPNDAHRTLPALVAAVSSPAGSLTGVQRTYLDPHRPTKADIPNPEPPQRVRGTSFRLHQALDAPERVPDAAP